MCGCSMWKRAMRAMDVGVEAAASPQCMVPLQARLELVNAIGQLNVSPSCIAPTCFHFFTRFNAFHVDLVVCVYMGLFCP